MSDGIKIRELDPTTTVSPTDVLVIDKDSFGDNSLTYHIEYQNFRESIFTGDINLDGSISVTGDISAGGDLVVSGDTTLQNTVNVNSDLNVTGTLSTNTLYVSGPTNLELDDLNDVDVSGAADKHFLMYDGTGWTSSLIDLDSIGGGGGGTQGDDFILLSGGQEPITFYVEVRLKSIWNQFYGKGSDDCFWLGTSPDDLHESPILMLPPNREFIFNQSHASNASRPLAFFATQSESQFVNNNFTGLGVGHPTGVPGIIGAQTTLEFTTVLNNSLNISEQTPYLLYYRCLDTSFNPPTNIKYMGSVVHNLGAKYQADVGNIPYLGNDTFPGAMNLLESLQDLNTRLETLESSS